jgi:hypothetical protein
MLLIVMTGAAKSGKTTACNLLVDEYGFTRLRFADAGKNMLLAMGLKRSDVDGDTKEVPSLLLGGKTPRFAMRTLMTEWARDTIYDDIWLDIIGAKINELRMANPDVRIVIDDCRFPNEYAFLTRLGAKVWSIRRPSVEPAIKWWKQLLAQIGIGVHVHASEQYWAKFTTSITVMNLSTRDELLDKTRVALHLSMPELLPIPIGIAA